MSDKLNMKEGYEAMIHMLYDYFENTGSSDITDILSGGVYLEESDKPADISFWYFWEEAVNKVKKGTPPKRQEFVDE